MYRIDTPNRLVDKFGTGKDGYTEGTPGVSPPTALTDDVFDAFQEEIIALIEYVGNALSKADNHQLLAAILKLMGMLPSNVIAAGYLQGIAVTATTGNVAAIVGSVSAGATVSAGTTVTGGTGVVATTGNVAATAGNVSAGGSVTAATGGVGGTNTGSGPGVSGISATGPGGQFTGNATKESIYVVPRASDPSSPNIGGLSSNSATGRLSIFSAGSVWHRMVGKNYSASSSIVVGVTANADWASVGSYSIPSGNLAVGSTIRARIGMNFSANYTGLPQARLVIGGNVLVTSPQIAHTGGDHSIVFDLIGTIRTTGGSGTIALTIEEHVRDNTTITDFIGESVLTVATDAPLAIDVQSWAAEGGATSTINLFVVDVSD